MTDIISSDWAEQDSNNTNPSPNGVQGGYAPSTIAPTIRALRGAIKRFYNQINPIYTSTGTGNAYLLTFNQAPAAYTKGQQISFWADRSNTGAATLNINGLGERAIIDHDGAALIAGRIPQGPPITLVFDGTSWRLQTMTQNPRFGGTVRATAFVGDGSGLTNTNASEIKSGTIDDARLPSTMSGKTFSNAITVQIANANVRTTHLGFRPTDFGVGKPGFYVTKEYDPQWWTIGLWDGASSNGNIQFGCNDIHVAGKGVVWHAGNDGAGSGLDADLLDGQNGTYYLDAANITGTIADARLPSTLSTKTFSDRLVVRGNAPIVEFRETDVAGTAAWYACMDGVGMTFRYQDLGNIFLDMQPTGVFKWLNNTIWHAGNDGAGSGLDADLLDGQDSSYFTNIPARLGYTPLNRAGDNMSGTLGLAGVGSNYLAAGNGDNATYSTHNIKLRGHWGLGFESYDGSVTGLLDFRAGSLDMKGGFFKNGVRAVYNDAGSYDIHITGSAAYAAGAGNANTLGGQNGSYYLNAGNLTGTLADARLPSTLSAKTFQNQISITGNAPILNFSEDTGSGIANWYMVGDGAGLSVRYGDLGNVFLNMTPVGGIEWQGNKVWHGGNDGAGSGLDADVLDGQQGSYYLNAGNLTGTIADARLPSFMTAKTFDSGVVVKSSANRHYWFQNSNNVSTALFYNNASTNDVRIVHYNTDGSFRHETSFQQDGDIGGVRSLYMGGGVLQNGNSQYTTDGNIYMPWAGAWLRDILNSKAQVNSANDFKSGNITIANAAPILNFSEDTGSGIANWYIVGDGAGLSTRYGDLGNIYLNMTPVGGIEWQGNKIWHAGNDGAGTGLDADLLDGIDSSGFVKNDTGTYNISTNGRAYPRRSDGAALNFIWNGQGGQPSWLWGGENGTDMYVYSPRNFYVNNSDNLSGYGGGSYLRKDEFDATFASKGYDQIGSVAFMRRASAKPGGNTSFITGDTSVGSELYYANADGSSLSGSGANSSGTWQCLGRCTGGATGAASVTMWKRIA